MLWWAVAALWAVCGPFAYAIHFADVQRRFTPAFTATHYRQDRASATFLGLFGPIGLLVATFTSGYAEYGLKWR